MSAPTFFVAACPCRGDAQVLAARALDPEGALLWACLHCGAPIDERSPSACWVEASALDALGYEVPGLERAPDEEEKQGGCRGGSCGVRQPGRDAV